MPDLTINQDNTIGAYFSNDQGPVTGVADMVVSVINRATGATVFSGSATESPANTGYYSAVVPAASLTVPMFLTVTFSSAISKLWDRTILTADDVPGWARTRRDIRQMVGRLLDGERAVWDFEPTSGTTLTAVVPDLNVGGDHEYRGMWARFNDGANRGLTRRLTDFTEATDTITWSPALPAAVGGGDRIELYKLDPRIIDREIDAAFSITRETALIPMHDRTITTDGVTTEFTIPTGVRRIARVGIKAPTWSMWLSHREWSIVGKKLVIGQRGPVDGDPFRWPASLTFTALPAGYTIMLDCLVNVNPPLYDDSYVDLLPEYVEAHCHWSLARMRVDLMPISPYLKRIRDEEMTRAVQTLSGKPV